MITKERYGDDGCFVTLIDKGDIGDCLVVLNNLAVMSGTTLRDCLQCAYDDIKDRKGHINSSGVFVKQEEQLK